MSTKIGIRPWIDFAFRKIFGKPGNEICLISLLNSVLDLPSPIESVQYRNPFSIKDFQDDKLVCVDVKATDAASRVFIVEIQLVIDGSFSKRALFYACSAYTDQLREGQSYRELKATYSVCLLMRRLWADSQLHHHFQLVERASGRIMEDSIEIHTVELSKYNGGPQGIRAASQIEQWCYWFKYADDHTPEELRELLPGLAFLRAIEELTSIQDITEEKEMYDSREKAILDLRSHLVEAREEGRQEGLEQGLERGLEQGEAIGKIQLLQELLGEVIETRETLSVMELGELHNLVRNLQSKLRTRDQ